MSTDELLTILKDRGLEIIFGGDGCPRLKGENAEKSKKLIRVLKLECHRAEIIRRFKPKMPRRIVLLDDNENIVKVLEECEGTGHHERIRKQAEQYPGQSIAGEWRQVHDGREQWTRFIRVCYQAAPEAPIVP